MDLNAKGLTKNKQSLYSKANSYAAFVYYKILCIINLILLDNISTIRLSKPYNNDIRFLSLTFQDISRSDKLCIEVHTGLQNE